MELYPQHVNPWSQKVPGDDAVILLLGGIAKSVLFHQSTNVHLLNIEYRQSTLTSRL